MPPAAAVYSAGDIWQDRLQTTVATPLTPQARQSLQQSKTCNAQTRIKRLQRARKVVEVTMDLLGRICWWVPTGSIFGKAQNPNRSFGTAPTAAWSAFRKTVPLRPLTPPDQPPARRGGEVAEGKPRHPLLSVRDAAFVAGGPPLP